MSFDEILNLDSSSLEEDTFIKEISSEIDYEKLREEFEELDKQRARDWSELSNKIVGSE
jgi:hypothetical protein